MPDNLTQGQKDAVAAARIYQASNGDPVKFAGAWANYLDDPSRLDALGLSNSDPSVVDDFNIGLDAFTTDVGDVFKKIQNAIGGAVQSGVDAANGVTKTIGLVQIGLVGIAGFALYKILSSDSAKQTIREIVVKK